MDAISYDNRCNIMVGWRQYRIIEAIWLNGGNIIGEWKVNHMIIEALSRENGGNI